MKTSEKIIVRKESKIVDVTIVSLIILIPLLLVTHHLLGVYFDLIFQYNRLAEFYFDETGVDKSMSEVYWFGFNVIDCANQAIMLDTILYVIFFFFFVLGILIYMFYVKPTRKSGK